MQLEGEFLAEKGYLGEGGGEGASGRKIDASSGEGISGQIGHAFCRGGEEFEGYYHQNSEQVV